MQPENNDLREYSTGADSSSLEMPPAEVSVQAGSPVPSAGRPSVLRFDRRSLFASAGIAGVIILIGAGVTGLGLFKNGQAGDPQSAAGQYSASSLSLTEAKVSQQLKVGDVKHLAINGQLQVTNTVVVKPTSAPDKATAGQIYYDSRTNQPYFYNGTSFVSMAQTPVIPGRGITVNGTTITNTGVLNLLSGSPNVVITTDGQGNFTITDNAAGTPANSILGEGAAGRIAVFTGGRTLGNSALSQNGTTVVADGALNVSQATTVGGNLTVSGAAVVGGNLTVSGSLLANGLQQTAAGADVAISAGNDKVIFTAGGRNFTLPVVGPASQTICTTGATCASGSGAAVILQPGSAQPDTGAGSSIFINNTGAGNLIQLQGAGADRFVVSNGGALMAVSGRFTSLAAGIVRSDAGGNLTSGTVNLGADTTGDYVSNLGALTGLTTTGNIGEGSTPTLSVTYGSTANTAVQGNTALLCASGTGNLTGGGNTVTLGSGGSCGNLTIINNPTFSGLVSAAGGLTVSAGQTLINAGASLFTAVSISDKPVGGNIGTAATTVDVATTFNVGQTTAGQALTLPNPTTATAGRLVYVNNVGSVSFTMYNAVIPVGESRSFMWNGSGWILVDNARAGTGLTQTGNTINSAAPTSVANDTNIQGSIASNVLTLSWSGQLGVARGGTGAATFTGNGILYGNGAGALQVTAAAANSVLVTSGLNVPSLSQTLPTAVQGNITSTGVLAGGSIVSGFGTISTANNITGTTINGTTGINTGAAAGTQRIDASGNLVNIGTITSGLINGQTIATSANFTGTVAIQGAGGLTLGVAGTTTGAIKLANAANLNLGTLQAAVLGQATTFTLPDPGAASVTICLSTGNCAGAGSSVTGLGTAGRIAKFNGAQNITDSTLTESGSTVTASGNLIIQGASSLTLGTSSTNTGSIVFRNSTNINTLTLQSGATSGNLTFTLPTADGTSGQCVKTNALGVLSFGDCLSGSGAGGGVSSLNTLTGALTIANSSGAGSTITIDNASTTAKGIAQFNSTNFSVVSGAVNTIQDIATSSSPVFVTINGTTGINTGAAAGTQRIDASGNLVNIGTITSGLINGQTISSAANFTGTVAIQGANALTLGTTGANTGAILFKGATAASGTLTLVGPANPSANTITLPNETGTVCTTGSVCAGYAPGSGSASYIQNGTALQTNANFNIQSAAAASVGGVIRGAASQTADLLQLQNSTGTILTAFQADGKLVFGPGAAQDTNLYRSAANTLKTDDNLTAAGYANLNGGVTISGLSTPAAPTVTPQGTAGTTSYSYAVTARNANGGETPASTAGTTTTGNAILSATNFNRLAWTAVPGATDYRIYRTASAGSPATTGLVGTTASLTFDDTGLAAGAAAPTTQTSDTLTAGTAIFKNQTNSATAFQIQNAAGTTLFGIDTSGSRLFTGVADGATAVGFKLDTSVAYATAGAKLLSLQNNAVEKFSVDKDGNVNLASGAGYFINGANINTAGTLSNVAYLNQNQTFTGTNTINTNAIAAFKVEQSGVNNNTLVVNTTSGRVGIGGPAANGILTVGTDTTTAAGGLYFGTDTNLYRSAINTLKTDDNLLIQTATNSTAAFQIQNAAAGSVLTVDTTTNSLTVNQGNLTVTNLATPAAPTVTNVGVTGTTTYTYFIVARNANGATIPGPAGTTTTGNAVLSATNYNTISWAAVPNATSYDVLKGNTSTLLANVTATSLNDQGQATSAYTPNTTNTTGGNLRAAAGITAFLGTAGQVDIGAGPLTPVITFGSAGDTNLYRSAANTLKTDDSFLIQTATNSATAFSIQNAAAQTLLVADTANQRIAIGPAAVPANGVLTVGTSTATAAGGLYFGTDANLYRSAASTLKTDGNLDVGQQLTVGSFSGAATITTYQAAAGALFKQHLLASDTQAAFSILGDGRFQWGIGGTTAPDTNLYRSAANTLKTDDNLLVQTAANSATAFSVLNAAGTGILTVDTTGAQALLGTASSSTGKLAFANSSNANTLSIQSGATSSSYTLTLPTALGVDGDCVKQSGAAGTLVFGGCGGSITTPSARVYNSTNTAVASGGTTMLPYNSERFDTDAIHDNVTNNSRLTINTTGKYSLAAQVSLTGTVADGRVQIAIFKNGTTVVAAANVPVGAYEGFASTVALDLVAGDYLEARLYNGSTVSITASAGFDFSVIKDDGGSGTGGSVPSVRAESVAAQSLTNNAVTYLTFDTEAYDTDSLHDNVTNNTRLTAKTAGKYTVFGQVYLQANGTGTRQVLIRKNGTTVVSSFYPNNAIGDVAQQVHIPVSTVVDMAAGDYIEMGAWQNSGGALNASDRYLGMVKLDGGLGGTLQGTYDSGNVITTTNARDVRVILADTATDGNFVVNVATGSTGQFQVRANDINTFTVNGTGQALFKNSTNSTTAFQVQDAASASLFTIDSTNMRIQIGSATADGTGVLLVLDTKNTAGDPAGVDGGMYYNSNLGRFRCYEEGAWRDCNSRSGSRKSIAVDVTNASSTVWTALTDMNYTLAASTTYRLKCEVQFKTTVSTSGVFFRPTYGFTPTNIYYNADMSNTATDKVQWVLTNASNVGSLSFPAANTPTPMYIDAIITVGATGGTLGMEFHSETTDTITAIAGSNCYLTSGQF